MSSALTLDELRALLSGNTRFTVMNYTASHSRMTVWVHANSFLLGTELLLDGVFKYCGPLSGTISDSAVGVHPDGWTEINFGPDGAVVLFEAVAIRSQPR